MRSQRGFKYMTAAVILSLAVWSGCGSSGWEARPVTEAGEPIATLPELSFGEQLERVRNGTSDRIEITKTEISDQEFSQVRELHGLKTLILDRGSVSDAALVHLFASISLEHLRLRESAVGDQGVTTLKGLKRLRILNLPEAAFSDEGLRVICQFPSLELLRFGSSRVTDEGLKFLPELKSLRFLHLINVPITDKGLKSLETIHSLESFYLDGSSTSDEGLSALIKARPGLHFHKDQRHLDFDPRREDHAH